MPQDQDQDEERKQRGSLPIVGEPLWKRARGRPVAFETPDDLWQAALDYFAWVEANPLWESKILSFQGDSWLEYMPKMRAMTMMGFQLHADICEQTWYNYKSIPDFLGIITRIEKTIREQKFTGAAADLLNASIIARDLGLTDKSESTVTATVKAETITANVTPQEAADVYNRLVNG